jgi:hypothetical protein
MNKPKRVFKRDSLRLSIWANKKKIKGHIVRTYSATIDKVYREGGNVKYSKSFFIEDLPKIASAADEAYQTFKKRNQRVIKRRKKNANRDPLDVYSGHFTKMFDDNPIDKCLGKISNVFNE